MDWEETLYLNLIVHQLVYTVTLAVYSRTSHKDIQVLRRYSQKVYATPSRRKMDGKGDSEEMTYPYVCFTVDNFDEIFDEVRKRGLNCALNSNFSCIVMFSSIVINLLYRP